MRVATIIHHLSLPLKRNSPRTKRNMVTAPRYIGPAVKGCGPQYIGNCFTVCFTLGCPARRRSSSVAPCFRCGSQDEAPPLKLGISKLGISLIPYDQAVAYSRSSPLAAALASFTAFASPACSALSAASSDPPRIVYFEYLYVGINLLAFVAIPIQPTTSSRAEAAKNLVSLRPRSSFFTHAHISSVSA